MKRETEALKTALRDAGFDACGFYSSGSDHRKGWVRVWWADRLGCLRVAPRLPQMDGRGEFLERLTAALVAHGWTPRLRAVAFCEEWVR